jgi:hypothetical protein
LARAGATAAVRRYEGDDGASRGPTAVRILAHDVSGSRRIEDDFSEIARADVIGIHAVFGTRAIAVARGQAIRLDALHTNVLARVISIGAAEDILVIANRFLAEVRRAIIPVGAIRQGDVVVVTALERT